MSWETIRMSMKPKILVVEDNVNVAEVLKIRLEYMGYEVSDVARSGSRALACMARLEPDLILMDISLEEGMDGIETATQIGKKWDTPVIYLTCLRDPQVLQRAMKTNPSGYLVKPYDKTELQTTIEIALNKYRCAKKKDRLIEELRGSKRI